MLVKHARAPRGEDLGPATPFTDHRISGSFVAAQPEAPKAAHTAATERRREQWREAQQRRRQKMGDEAMREYWRSKGRERKRKKSRGETNG